MTEQPKRTSPYIFLLWFLVIITACGFVVTALTLPHIWDRATDGYDAPQDTAENAIYAARGLVQKTLKSPNSAKFPTNSSGEYRVTALENGAWKVSGYVDARNSFNAEIRTRWEAIVRYDPQDRMWYLLGLETDD